MKEIKAQIFTILQELEEIGVKVFQVMPEDNQTFPCVSYYIGNNEMTYTMANGVGFQRVEVVVDIWSKDSEDAEDVLLELESIMRNHGWLMSFSSDVPEPDGFNHINNRFYFLT